MKITCLGDANRPGSHWKNYRVETDTEFIVVVARDLQEASDIAESPHTWKADSGFHYTDENGTKHPAYGTLP